MLLLPDGLKNATVSAEGKRFLLALKNRLPDEYTGVYGINLSGSVGDEHFILVSPDGLIVMRFFDFQLDVLQEIALDSFCVFFTSMQQRIERRLLSHRALKDEKGHLLFPIRLLYVFNGRNPVKKFEKKSNNQFVDSCFRNSEWLAETRRNSESVLRDLLKNPDNKVSDKAIMLTKEHIDVVINRLAPWCTIPKLPADINEGMDHVHSEDPYKQLKKNDSLVEVLRLDPAQVDIVNTIKNGHQLILACAGSGKSAILIARCFRMASMDKTKEYLLTCYNTNLNKYYRWQIDEAGLSEKNVHCLTFHALCRQIILDAGYTLPQHLDGYFNKAKEAFEAGRVKKRYYGIFIDEVQIFKPEWYQFCLKLLASPEPEKHVIVICGDITQDIRKTIRKSKAPWQGEGLPSYVGRTLHIEKNYRNCIPINKFINSYATETMKYLERIEGAITPDSFLRGKATREGHKPELVQFFLRDDRQEAMFICNCIKKMHDEYMIGYTDIAILLYNQGAHYLENWKYNILGKLRVCLFENHIPYTQLSWKSGADTGTYQSRNGVSLMTFEGSLGLDYRGVVVAGLPTIGAYTGVYKFNKETILSQDETIIEDYVQGFKSLYLACTRAKDALMIVAPTPQVFSSDYTKVLFDAYANYQEDEQNGEC